MTSVLQPWVDDLPIMQQSVLLASIRGPDGLQKYHPVKYVLRWYRRCILLSAIDQRVLLDPCSPNGGSFTGPSLECAPDWEHAHHYRRIDVSSPWRNSWSEAMDDWVTSYLRNLDEVPLHFHLHFMHAIEILGYKHPDDRIRAWWRNVYIRVVKDMHLVPEPVEVMDDRLSDDRDRWLAHGDEATND